MAVKSLVRLSEIVTFVSEGILWGETAFCKRLYSNSFRGYRFEIGNFLSADKQKSANSTFFVFAIRYIALLIINVSLLKIII